MALLVTLFLVLVNIFNSVTGNAPKAEGLTAVETWVSQSSFSASAMMSYHITAVETYLLFILNAIVIFMLSIIKITIVIILACENSQMKTTLLCHESTIIL